MKEKKYGSSWKHKSKTANKYEEINELFKQKDTFNTLYNPMLLQKEIKEQRIKNEILLKKYIKNEENER